MTKMKVCFKCGKRRPKTSFYRHPMMADGHLGKCKACTKADVMAHRAANIERVREYDRVRGRNRTPEQRARVAAYGAKWMRENPGKAREYEARSREKRRANHIVNNAVRAGRLEKPKECENCGRRGRLDGHHDDYEKPLEVRWLCRACHAAVHVAEREAARASA